MPLILGLAAMLAAGAFFAEKMGDLGQRSGVFPPASQTTVPETKGTLGQNVDKLGTAASAGLVLVSAALAYSLVKR